MNDTLQSSPIVHQILDPGFLHKQLETVRREAGEQLSDEQYKEMFARLEAADASPVSGASPAQGRQAYLPRSPAVSLLQSTLTDCVTSRFEDLVKPLPPGESSFADYVLRVGEVFRKFGPCDAGWVESVISKGLSLLHNKPNFVNAPPDVTIAENARVIVAGDWGTGLAGAKAVGEQMAARVQEAKTENREVHVLHLGDVYYSGWKEEYEARFFPHWPVHSAAEGVPSWALNGNHDMYSGGHGYFGYLLRDPRFAAQQGSSYFCLRNSNWQLLGLDSAYEDEDLGGDQAGWVAEKHKDAQRKTMLLTHHEPFSSFGGGGTPKMVEKLKPAFAERQLDAWLWGHEHLCCVYEPEREKYLRFGSCIGHGGVPVLHDGAAKPSDVAWRDEGYEAIVGEKWQLCGLAVLDFDGPKIDVRYYSQLGGEPVYSDTIE